MKPSNALLAGDGTPKIGDFGLAKLLDDDSARTLSGEVLGTPSFMAPEQAEGRSRDVGPAADINALGAILYESILSFEKAHRTLEDMAGSHGKLVSRMATIQSRIAELDINLLNAYASDPVRYATASRALTAESFEICDRLSIVLPVTWDRRSLTPHFVPKWPIFGCKTDSAQTGFRDRRSAAAN